MFAEKLIMMRYFIGFVIAIGLIVLIIILIFSGGGPTKTPRSLTSYANTDAIARLTVDGPINASQNHQQLQISVDRNTVTYQQMQGYDGKVVNLQTYANGFNAYDAFLHALARVGFASGNSDPKLSDEKGYCPLGSRYIFELMQDGKDVERYWATSCGSGAHTYGGNVALTLSMFKAQVPDYNSLTSQLDLNL